MFEDKRFAYDAHGNLTDKKVGRHTHIQLNWNAEHQLVRSQATRNAHEAHEAQPTAQSTEYGYDPFGRRVFKRDAFGETRFAWDGNRLLAETRGSRTRTYVYAGDSFAPLAQVDSLLSGSNAEHAAQETKSSAEILYFHTDHLGTPRELTDGDGNLQWAASYKAWGNVLQVEWAQTRAMPVDQAQENQLAQSQALRFQGQYFDVETGLHYNRFRYYDPDVGRFVSLDPIGLQGGNNLYQYAPNPVTWIDPWGLAPCKKYEVGKYDDLKKRSVPGDGLDIHHAVQKHPAGQVIPGYDLKTGPSIAIPALEHSQIPTGKGIYTGTVRDLLAKDIMDLRRATDVSNSTLKELIDLNKKMFPAVFGKP